MPRSVDQIPKLGQPLDRWQAPARPQELFLSGRYAKLAPLSASDHGEELFSSYLGHDQVWDFLPYGPFERFADYRAWLDDVIGQQDPYFLAIQNLETGKFEGVASFLRISPEAGSLEVGHINFSPSLQKTRAATEAMFLMMGWAFQTGYRRYEWKCDALNMGSRRAAERLGFSYEGVFRQATVVKGRNRDTAWFATIDAEWPKLQKAFEQWLAPENFLDGVQKTTLSTLTASLRVSSDPALVTRD